jgi:putative membrane protein
MRFLVRLVINAFALWLTTLIVAGVHVVPYEPGDSTATVLTFLLVAFIFGIVNGVIGTLIRIVAFPLYVLSLGLLALIVNGLLLLLVAWVSGLFGFGLVIDGFWWGVLGAIVLAVLSWLISIVVRPVTGPSPRRR